MNVLTGLNSFLVFINNNWTTIAVTIGLVVGIIVKIRDYFSKDTDEKVAIAKTAIKEYMLKLVSDAEMDYEDWKHAGSIKRAQVIGQIYADYPILYKVVDQEELIKWIDNTIDEALVTLRAVICTNNG